MSKSLENLVLNDAIVPQASRDVQITGLTADSRKVQPGFLFAALSGAKAEGVSFIPQALQNGAAAVLVGKGTYSGPGIVIEAENPRHALARIAARFFGDQPDTLVAVTGTNGKTSVAVFVRQIWAAMGFRAASLGTIGLIGPQGQTYLQHTTPDPVELQAMAAQLREDHISHLAIEASSHGLEQRRLDGLRFTAAAFTNLSHDHLDYHSSMEDYFHAKMRLFEELLPQGAGAVINMDSDYGARVEKICLARGHTIVRVGSTGADIKLLSARREGLEQHLRIATRNAEYSVTVPLAGAFQISNCLVAAGLVIAAGGDENQTFHALESLRGAPGRLEFVGNTADGASAFVDYAHTPDALENAIATLRPYATGKLWVVFGCGGDRDKAKRPVMGEIATRLADCVIVTDDNPRTEDARFIRAAIMATAKGASEIGDRAEAIRAAIKALRRGDVLLVAGKGHEEGQTVGTVVHPFSDHIEIQKALTELAQNG